MIEPEGPLIQIVREGLEKACKEFTARVKPLGFTRTKKMIWTRQRDLTVDFITFSRSGSSYGAPRNASVTIVVGLGIRVLNDNFDALASNGPTSDDMSKNKIRAGRYHLRFNARSGDTFSRCVDDHERFVIEQGEPYFKRFSSIWNLLYRWDSPLDWNLKKLLRKARSGQAAQENVIISLNILGLKQAKKTGE
jgi:hypothetical protein